MYTSGLWNVSLPGWYQSTTNQAAGVSYDHVFSPVRHNGENNLLDCWTWHLGLASASSFYIPSDVVPGLPASGPASSECVSIHLADSPERERYFQHALEYYSAESVQDLVILSETGDHTCKVCRASYKKRWNCVRHVEDVLHLKKHRCVICNQEMRADNIKSHCISQHPCGNWQCADRGCPKVVRLTPGHLTPVCSDGHPKYVCQFCGTAFTTPDDLRRHEENKHG